MRSERVTPEQVLALEICGLVGAVLLAPCRLDGRAIAKGTRVDEPFASELQAAARGGLLTQPLRLAWPGPNDVHEDVAADRLARAVSGPGIIMGRPVQSRIDLTARTDGVLRVNVEGLGQLNRIDPLEVFTLFHGQAVRGGRVVASVKVAPHLVWEGELLQGEILAKQAAPLIDVDPYLPLQVAAIAAESLAPAALARFTASARMKISALGGVFVGTSLIEDGEVEAVAGHAAAALEDLALRRAISIILVGGVSAGDPLSPFYDALQGLGGRVLRRGVPAHPGSMIWFAQLGASTIMGLPQCGMFSMATAADLVLPRLLTGEAVTPATLADLGHGGLLGPEMRFRFPEYARDLEAPGT
jgi:molybdenum cofactor cytidylyltransferase